ncbi:tetratricopeptide repeat protein [Bradyrhizobium guangdongense]|uniref:Tetratricopeptide repeat protein 38 n=1 Tax=Bradyrhizobium guangdongense TaxID=1325090 RepID=A0A410V0L5_9BRAD|nr:tetratricopeptide repeat protein [Bradyrhizobium guangdongense]QAU37196.1 tetratricopeptide repeat protein [Bradyrhizobium guangdongense]QOZ58251.1 tetratricopeptide repeat protein [Bradyrhizobium guangdongense]GGI20927.1 tetratricopeptide repeat protein 38 family protein [Bradyrhizobium guangdongense]
MALEDRYGLPLSTASDQAASAYREGVDLMLSGWTGTAEALERAIAADPDFALAHIARARVHAFYQQGDLARSKAALARELVAISGTERERSHVETLALAIEGRGPDAIAAMFKHVESWPRDAVVLSLPLGAFGLFAFSGMADHDRARHELCQSVAHRYGEDWWFLTMSGWAMTENGDVVRGRAVTERGFDLRRANAHAAHAVLHAMFEDGSIEDADHLVDDWIPTYDRAGILHGHILWHQALGALERGDATRALQIYADVLQPSATQAPPLNAITDGASLLWRLSAYGHSVPKALWVEADAAAQKLFPKSGLPFADVHMALFAAATQNCEALAARLAAIEQRLADGKLPAGPVLPAICRGLAAFADENYAACVRELDPVLAEIARIGGSHAQRELIEDAFLLALIRSGELPRARKLLDARLHRRPSLRDTRWQAAIS